MAIGAAEVVGKPAARLLSRRPYLFLLLVPFLLVACDDGRDVSLTEVSLTEVSLTEVSLTEVSLPEVSLTEVEWDILLDDPEWDPGVHSIGTIVEVRPLTVDAVQDVFGSLVWEPEDTFVDLCQVEIRGHGPDYVHIGDIYQTIEGCGENPTAMQDAFDDFGLPDRACVGVVTTSGDEHEYCSPLTEISGADL